MKVKLTSQYDSTMQALRWYLRHELHITWSQLLDVNTKEWIPNTLVLESISPRHLQMVEVEAALLGDITIEEYSAGK